MPAEPAASLPTLPAHRAPLRLWIDRFLAIAGLVVTLLFVVATARELLFRLETPGPTTMWENPSLEAALRLRSAQPLYPDWTRGPVLFAIYGPAYYLVLATGGALSAADNLAMIDVGRWTGIVSLVAAVLAGAFYVRRSRAPLWAVLLAPACVGLLSPTMVRFVASARPDVTAAAFSLLALLFALERGRVTAIVAGLLMAAATHTKVTAVAAPIAVALTLWPSQRRRAVLVLGTFAGTTLLIWVVLLIATDGWIARHLAIAALAPTSPHHLWYLFMYGRSNRAMDSWIPYPGEFELTALLVYPLLLLLSSRLWLRRTSPGLIAHERWAGASWFFLVSLGVAFAGGLHRGSDRNYLIEPALAAGPLLGLWAARIAAARGSRAWLPTRAIALAALCSPMLPDLPLRFNRMDATSRELLRRSGYGKESEAWIRSLPQPLLCMDAWLTYRAAIVNGLNDPVCYASYFTEAEHEDIIAKRAEAAHYATIVTFGPVEEGSIFVYDDIPSVWPALRDAIRKRYDLKETRPPWWVYVPKPEPERDS